MPVGEKSKYTDKQERKADHIAESYEQRGVPEKEAERRAWATVNKDDGGGKAPGGRGADARPAIPPLTRAVGSAARRPRRGRPRAVRRRQEGRRDPQAPQLTHRRDGAMALATDGNLRRRIRFQLVKRSRNASLRSESPCASSYSP